MTAKIKGAVKQTKTRHKHKPKNVSKHDFEKVYWPFLPVILVLGVLISISLQNGVLATIVRHPTGKVLDYATSMSTSQLLASTNGARSSNGVASLSLNGKLNSAAQAKANDMASRNYWSHYTPEGTAPWAFVENQGYTYQKLGENLAAGFSDEQATVNGWMGSPSHRENMLDTAFSEVGFGFANNPDYTSAGGGPMTIVVAYYGKPQTAPVAAPTTPTPTKPNQAVVQSETAQSAPQATPPVETSKPQPVAEPEQKTAEKSAKPVNSDTLSATPIVTGTTQTSRAQLAFSTLSNSSTMASLVSLCLLGALSIWAFRHLMLFRRVFVNSEAFVIRHPLMDVGLLVIAALSFLLTQTAGLIQ